MGTRISFNPLLLLLEIFSKPLCFFWTWMVLTLPPHCWFKILLKGKTFQGVEGKWLQVILSLLFSLRSFFFCCYCCCCCCSITYVFFFLFWVSLVFLLCFALLNMFLLFRKYKNSMCFVYIGTCVPWMAIETKFSKLCIFCDLDEHLYAQLSKWVLWLLFVMSKIKLSLVLNTRITLFDEKD